MVLGLDKDIQSTRRTDVIMFVSVNINTKEIKITSIPRDLIIDGAKINSFYQKNGFDSLKDLIEKFFGKHIDRYAIVDYDIVRLIGDEIGPIEVYVDQPMKYTDYSQNLIIDFEPGLHKLYGKELLAYMRFRKDYNGDLGRIERQKYVINQLIKAALKKDIFTLAKVYKEVYNNMETNIKASEIVFLATKFRNGFNIKSIPFPVKYGLNGNIYPGDLDILKNGYSSQNEVNTRKNYKFYIINNTENQNRTYNVNLYYMWKASGFIPKQVFFLNEPKFKTDIVYVLNEEYKLDEIKEITKIVHPKRDFKIVYAKEYIEEYLSLINALSMKRNYIDLSADFIVILAK